MKKITLYNILTAILLCLTTHTSAQIKGIITDSISGEPLMYITVQYEGKGVGSISNVKGEYEVESRRGWNELTFSAVGYVTKRVKFTPDTRQPQRAPAAR